MKDDLAPEIMDVLSFYMPLFLTVQNILDNSKVISFGIDPQTFSDLRKGFLRIDQAKLDWAVIDDK